MILQEEISTNCGFYLPTSKKAYIKMKYDIDRDWKVLVRETLLEVYGSSIANYSATGKRGKRPPLSPGNYFMDYLVNMII